MGEGLGTRVKTVQHPIASDPQHAGAVFEQRIDIGSRQTVHSTRLVHKYLEFVTVVAIDTVLRAEPDEAAIILDDLRNTGLRKTVYCRHAGKASASTIDDGNVHHFGGDARQWNIVDCGWRDLCARAVGQRHAWSKP